MRRVDPRGLRDTERVRGRRSGDDGLLRPEPRQLPTDAHPPQLGHHCVDHARRPAARVVLADRPQDGRRSAVPDAPNTGAHRHVVGPQTSNGRGTVHCRGRNGSK